MPAEFYSSWTVTAPDIQTVSVPLQAHYCRDIAYHAMTRDLSTRFGTSSIDDLFLQGWRYWVEKHKDTFYFEASALPVTTHREWAQEKLIPCIIQILTPRYPGVVFIPVSHYDDWGCKHTYGAALSGNTDIIPAYYWFIYFMRRWHTPTEALTDDLTVRLGADHRKAWADNTPGLHMLIARHGPINTDIIYTRGDFTDAKLAGAIRQTADVFHHRHRWFHED